jgi:DNA-binding transcriptional MocR family regulator
MERGYLRAHTARVVREYRTRRDALGDALERALPSGFAFHRPSHGVVMWIPLPKGVDPDAVHAEALRQGVLVTPTNVWAADATAEPGVRLAFCAEPPDRLELGGRRLAKAIRVVMGQGRRREPERDAPLEMV